MRNLIALAIPFFLLLIGVEILVARARGREVYRVQDALADLGCGVGQQLVLVFAAAALLAGYAWCYRFRVVDFEPGSPVPWLIAFVVVDLSYYWWHRLSHEVNVLWAAHVVHHQSEDYNLAVALRQSILTSFTSVPFYYPMALLGVPPAAYATMAAVSLLYQFWIHTELVGRLGWLERVLNTPSHHRVHHAVNPQYLDRNYGAILIVWDRLFGTFAEEREAPVYGTTKPLRSFHPLWAQVHGLVEIAEKARGLPTWRQRARVWLAHPAWTPDGAPPPGEAELRARARFGVPVRPGLQAYAVAQFAPVVLAIFLMLLWQDTAATLPLVLAALFVAWTLLSLGGLMDGARWARPLELARIAGAAAVAVAAARATGLAPVAAPVAALAWAGASAAWLLRCLSPAAPRPRRRSPEPSTAGRRPPGRRARRRTGPCGA
jgi:sterol desaturase/sphingolipid hydroxylase (fatty acid hydroxylase superfamily)